MIPVTFDPFPGRIPEDCLVCHEELRDDIMAHGNKEWKHAFHRTCLELWTDISQTCPSCRAPISTPYFKNLKQKVFQRPVFGVDRRIFVIACGILFGFFLVWQSDEEPTPAPLKVCSSVFGGMVAGTLIYSISREESKTLSSFAASAITTYLTFFVKV